MRRAFFSYSAGMAHVVLGTAGHIDHGKTSLVQALTGTDTDRLKEEKERGITIELGFAVLTLPSGQRAALLDVPGHERFVRTMVAGAVGLDAVLLVIAANEGVMPQTQEHLDICGLLGMQQGLVVLTKCDLVDDDLRALAVLEIKEALGGTFLADAPIVPVSTKTGEGLAALTIELERLVDRLPGRPDSGLVRLPVDRVFALPGFGTVVAGTLWSGSLPVGCELTALPHERARGKVRGVHVHGQAVAVGMPGQRVAVNWAVDKERVARGDLLVETGALRAERLLCAQVRLVGAQTRLKRRNEVLFYAAAAQRLATVTLLASDELSAGEQGLAQIELQEGLGLLPGDRFVLRGFAHSQATLGGGQVLTVGGPRRRSGEADVVSALSAQQAALADLVRPARRAQAIAALVEQALQQAGEWSWTRRDLAMVVPASEAEITQALLPLLAAGTVIATGTATERDQTWLASQKRLTETQDVLHRLLTEAHRKEPGEAGLSLETLRRRTGQELLRRVARVWRGTPRDAGRRTQAAHLGWLVEHAAEDLLRRGVLLREGDRVRLASHRPSGTTGEEALGQRVLARVLAAGLAAPRLDELTTQLGPPAIGASDLRRVIDAQCRAGQLVVIKEHVFAAAHIEKLRAALVDWLTEHTEITPSQWKELVGQSRKYTIPLAEHFDAQRVTLRVGDVRRLRAGGARKEGT